MYAPRTHTYIHTEYVFKRKLNPVTDKRDNQAKQQQQQQYIYAPKTRLIFKPLQARPEIRLQRRRHRIERFRAIERQEEDVRGWDRNLEFRRMVGRRSRHRTSPSPRRSLLAIVVMVIQSSRRWKNPLGCRHVVIDSTILDRLRLLSDPCVVVLVLVLVLVGVFVPILVAVLEVDLCATSVCGALQFPTVPHDSPRSVSASEVKWSGVECCQVSPSVAVVPG
jgi:hypothetical protein